jgi:hypothetical protein
MLDVDINNTTTNEDHPVAADTEKVVALTMEGDRRNTTHRTVHRDRAVGGTNRKGDRNPTVDRGTRAHIKVKPQHIGRTAPQGAVREAPSARDHLGRPSEEGHHPDDRRVEEAPDMYLMVRVRVRARVIDQAEAAEDTTRAGAGEAKAEEEEAEEDLSDLAMDAMGWSPSAS